MDQTYTLTGKLKQFGDTKSTWQGFRMKNKISSKGGEDAVMDFCLGDEIKKFVVYGLKK